MKRQRSFVGVSLMACLIWGLVGGALIARADPPREHPHYLRALSDLRHARAFLTVPGEDKVVNHEKVALLNIDKTIDDIKRAAIDDGKDLNDHPPIDTSLKHRGRLSKAVALLTSARRDLQFEREDDKPAQGWRRAAIKHLDEAVKAAKQAMNTVRNED